MGKLWPEDTYDDIYQCEAYDDEYDLDIAPADFRREWEKYTNDDYEEYGPSIKGIRLA